jgi:hypothetical protein
LCTEQVLASVSSTLGMLKFTTGFSMILSTLSRSKGKGPLAAKSAIMFFVVKAFLLAGLKREVKCCL